MHLSCVVLASLVLVHPASAAYSLNPDARPDTRPVVKTVSPCEVVQTGFSHLKQEIVARQPNALMAEALNATTSPYQLILALGLLRKPPPLTTVRPIELVTVLSFAFVEGVAALDDQAGYALILALMEAKGVCAQG